jgi:hypothetical protein
MKTVVRKAPRMIPRSFLTIRLFEAELLVKLIDPAAGVYQLLLTGIKGVTLGADFYLDILLCAPRFDDLTASAPDSRLLVVGMDPYLHYVHLFLLSLMQILF